MPLVNETLATYPLDTDYKPTSWNEYTQIALKDFPLYHKIVAENWKQENLQELFKASQFHPLMFDLITSYKDQPIAERTGAFYLSYSLRGDFEKSLIDIYASFEKQFPESVYLPYLDKEVEVVCSYHKKIKEAFSEAIAFIENQEYTSFNDLMHDLKGDKYYVDVWATWCAPCKQEFKHNKQLEALLKEKGYDKLYISLDRDDRAKKWQQDIKYFDLFGKHLRASQAFFEDFEQAHSIYKGYVAIPQYLIINEKGELVTNNAPRPSQLDALREIL